MKYICIVKWNKVESRNKSVKHSQLLFNKDVKRRVKDGKIVAEGMLVLVEGNLFYTEEAFEKFASDPVIQGLHGKKSWSDITIGFEVPVK